MHDGWIWILLLTFPEANQWHFEWVSRMFLYNLADELRNENIISLFIKICEEIYRNRFNRILVLYFKILFQRFHRYYQNLI